MDRDELIALAERCETAMRPDRELDAEIALALGIVTERDGNVFFGHKDYSCMVLERSYYDIEGSAPELPAYSASIDAAMTLPEDGEASQILNDAAGRLGQIGWVGRWRDSIPRFVTAACLRARAEIGEPQ